MPYLDLIIALPLAWGMFRGFRRGLIIEICTLMALVLGVYGAAVFGDMGADFLIREFNTDPQLSLVLGFALLFFLIVAGVFLFGKMLEGVVKMVALGLVNKIFGLLFGLAKFLLILSALFFIWNGFPPTSGLIPDDWKRSSYLYGPVSDLAPAVYPALKDPTWTEVLEQTLEELRDKADF